MVRESKNNCKEYLPLEETVEKLLQKKPPVITVDAVLDALAVKKSDSEEYKKLFSRVVRELNYHIALIPVEPQQSYVIAADLFTNAEFIIVPDAFEIENNILIPGHRFVPFMHPELFPSDITLRESGARKAQSLREFSGIAENIIKYHLLMGAETLFDFFIAESEDNVEQAENSANPQLKLSALDMKKFYAETNFTEGDTLLVKVIDYEKGVFEFRLGNGKERSAGKLAAYRTKFENVLENITENLQPGFPVIDQIRSLFANAPEFLNNPAMSLDEILLNDSLFDIAMDEDGSTLVKRVEEDDDCCGSEHHHTHDCDCHCHEHHHDRQLPENVTIGSGETGSLETMLAKLFPMLNIVELDAILLDNLKNHDLDFNSFYARAFGDSALPFADGMQEAVFFNELEARFEEMLDNYPREFDNETAEIRSMIVEFTIERCALLAQLSDIAGELDIKPELFEALAEAALLLDESLKLVNAPAALGEDFDFAEFRIGVENALESGEEALNALRGVLDIND